MSINDPEEICVENERSPLLMRHKYVALSKHSNELDLDVSNVNQPSEQQRAEDSNQTSEYTASKQTKRFSFFKKTCPTCNGTGRVNKDEMDKLVALIPLSDNRLKPKRIWLWVLITIGICLSLGFIVSFFLAPRSIQVSNDLKILMPYKIEYVNDVNSSAKIGIILYFEERYSIKNNNYFSIIVHNMNMQIERNSHVITPELEYAKDVIIPRRSTQLFSVKIKYAMYAVDDPYAYLCINGFLNNLFSLISTTFVYSSLWNVDEQISLSSIQYINCQNRTLNQLN